MEPAEKLSERNARYERGKVGVASIYIGSQTYGDVLTETLNVFIQEFLCEFHYVRISFKSQNGHCICPFRLHRVSGETLAASGLLSLRERT
jgi:hypothetical protein